MNIEKYKTGIRKMQTAAGGPIHYSRTMTSDNLSQAANYIGGYVLRGLGALGKIFTAPLTGGPIGTNTVPLYPRTVLLANVERKLRETQEELIGKAMTWVSPLNYGVALAIGNGLNARKGEEEVASWSPAWLAATRLGELYVGPKAVKGVKSAPRAVVNTAAKAGVKPAKAAVVAREINRETKLGVQTKNNIVGASYDYRMEDPKGSMDFLKQFFALLKINGKEYTLEGLRDAANVQQGLPEHIQSYLNLNTVERAVRAMKKEGYSEREILLYIDKVNEEMNKVKVGMYSDEEYNAAGALDFGGFYNNDLNFISVNKDAYLSRPKFTSNYILKHEGRHLIDYNTSMTDAVINILEKAYDKDFLEIPKHEDAGNLKNYLHMDRERVTTNRDARDVLLSNLEKHPGEFLNLTKFAQTSPGKYKDMVDFLNELILYAEPEDVISAVENSNGYGRRYINYLKKNNKLTSTKIEQLRLAMIHVPSYLLPITGGYTLYNLFNQPQLQYLKQGGKMNTLNILKNGGGIHIKEKNKGKFTSYCGGKVTSACILKGKNSSDPAVRKRATFAANARTWKHQQGGMLTQTDLTPWIRHKTFEEFDSLGRKLYNRYDSTYIADMMEDGGKVEKGQEGLTAKNDNTRVVKPFHMSPIKSIKKPKQAYINSVSLDEMDRRNQASKQRQYHKLLYKDLHLWNIDPTQQVTRNNVGFAFANAGIQGEPIRLGLSLYGGTKGIQYVGRAATNFAKSIPGRARVEGQMFKESFTTPAGRLMWGRAAGRFINPLKWTTGTGGVMGNLAYWETKGKMFQPISGVIESAILKSQGTDGGLTEQELKVNNDSIDAWLKDYDLNAEYTLE